MAAATRAGEKKQALRLLFPAATTKVTPDAMALLTAASRVLEAPPPRLMFATAGSTALAFTQLTPLMTPVVVPDPAQLRTRTATSATLLATPHVAPPTVPATWVPCPLQSAAGSEPSTASNPSPAPPPNSF